MSDSTVTLGDLLKEYEGDLEVLPAGEYEGEFVNVKPRATDIVPTLKVTVGPYAGKKFMIGVISWNGNAVSRSFQRMREIGLGKEFFAGIGAEGLPIKTVMELTSQALKGRVVKVTIGIEEPNQYHEDYRNKLEKFNGLVSAPAVQLQTGIPAIPTAPPVAVAPPVAAAPVAQAPIAVAQPVVQAAPPAPVAVQAVPVAAPVAQVAEQQVIQQADVAQLTAVVPTAAVPVATAPAAAPVAVPVAVAAPVAAPGSPVAVAAGVQPGQVSVTDEPDF